MSNAVMSNGVSNDKEREQTRVRVARWRAASAWRRKAKNNEYNRRYRAKRRRIKEQSGLGSGGGDSGDRKGIDRLGREISMDEGAIGSGALHPGGGSERSSPEERRIADWLIRKRRERFGVEVELIV